MCPPAVAASLDSVDFIPWEASSVEVMRRSPDGDNCCAVSDVVVVLSLSSFVEGLAQVSSLFSVLHPSSLVVVVASGASSAETVNIIRGCSSTTVQSSTDAAIMSHSNVVRGAAFRLIVVICLRWICCRFSFFDFFCVGHESRTSHERKGIIISTIFLYLW